MGRFSKEISVLDSKDNGEPKSELKDMLLNKEYNTERTGLKLIMEKSKHCLVATIAKLGRYN